MAEEKKTTKATKAKKVAEEAVETAVVTEEVAVDAAPVAEETPVVEAVEETPAAEETPVVEEVEQAEEPKTEDILPEEVQELVEEVSNVGKEIESITEVKGDTVDGLKAELKKVEDIEAKIAEEVKKTTAALSPEQKKTARRISGFSEFWSGVSDGWNN